MHLDGDSEHRGPAGCHQLPLDSSVLLPFGVCSNLFTPVNVSHLWPPWEPLPWDLFSLNLRSPLPHYLKPDQNQLWPDPKTGFPRLSENSFPPSTPARTCTHSFLAASAAAILKQAFRQVRALQLARLPGPRSSEEASAGSSQQHGEFGITASRWHSDVGGKGGRGVWVSSTQASGEH